MREMVLDRCFSTGKEFTREELMAIVNEELMQRDMLPVRSRNTFMLDIQEMNSKFSNMYGVDCLLVEKRGRKHYYRYRDGIESLYNRELTGKQHNHLMRDIRNMERAWEKVAQSKFGLGSYKDLNGQLRPCYLLTKTECLYIATKFNDEARAKLATPLETFRASEEPEP